jgi:hypothetical protein
MTDKLKSPAAKMKAVEAAFKKLHEALSELNDDEFRIRVERLQTAWVVAHTEK